MPATVLDVSATAARRFLRRALLIDAPVPLISAALVHHGYIQIDPINVCGRMHDLIARNRVTGYREGDLMRHLHGEEDAPLPAARRVAFEHHLPSTGVLVAFPLEAWPHLLAAMRARMRRVSAWSGRLTKREEALAEDLLAEMAARGALSSDDIDDTRRARAVWGKSSLVKATLQKLFFHGRVLIARRDGNRRRYDLPERVLPAATLAMPEPSSEETARWLALLKLRQRRLVTLKRDELRLVEDAVRAVRVPDCPPLHCLREDEPLLEAVVAGVAVEQPGGGAARLIAPLDPLIYDRRLTARLWGFDYIWEAYTPAHRRTRGHYALPVLAGDELVGHVEPKADRAAGRLVVVSRKVRGRCRTAPAVAALAEFLGLRAAGGVKKRGGKAK